MEPTDFMVRKASSLVWAGSGQSEDSREEDDRYDGHLSV